MAKTVRERGTSYAPRLLIISRASMGWPLPSVGQMAAITTVANIIAAPATKFQELTS